MAGDEVLSAPHVMEFPYTRSTGPMIGAFLTGLRDRVVLGVRDSTGRLLVPPPEYDPVTAATLPTGALEPVGPEGTVTSWSWNPRPRPGQPFAQPFAWALVRLDGADSSLLHAVSGPRENMATGMRVRIRWAAEPVGMITDIASFEAVPS